MTRRNTYRAILTCALIAVAPTVVAPVRAQAVREVVLPAGTATIVQITAPRDSQLSVDKGRFKGTAQIVAAPDAAKYSLVVIPDRTDGRTDLSVIRQGRVHETIRVFPVVTAREESTVESRAALPDPTSREYTIVSQGSQPGSSFFNGEQRAKLRTMQISGMRVVIEPNTRQGTYERLMPGGFEKPMQDLASLEIFARDVVIGAPLRLPGTKVTIYAEHLEFQDKPGSTAFIDVTPLPRTAQTPQGAAGLPGQAGPEVNLYISQPFADGGKVRVIARGAKGQQGGPPAPGVPGPTFQWVERDGPGTNGTIGGISRSWKIPSFQDQKKIHDPLPPGWGDDYNATLNTVWVKKFDRMEFGTEGKWPDDATAGKAGGIPGVGGPGGQVHASVALPATSLDIRGGDAGDKQDDGAAAAGGTPEWAVGVRIDKGRCRGGGGRSERDRECDPDVYHFYSHKSKAAAAVPSPDQPTKFGEVGSSGANLKGWFHPLAARARLRYAEDLYRIGLITEARKELDAISAAASSAGGATNPTADYVAITERVSALSTRLSSNLDYFGHPAGWAPLVNFNTQWMALQAEIKSIAPILIGTEQVRLRAEQGAARKDDLVRSRDAALADMKQTEEDLKKISEEIPRLGSDAQSIAQDEAQLKTTIREREARLQDEAEDATRVGFLKGALKTIGAIATVIPVAQPLLGAVGGAMNFLATIDERTPWESLTQIPSMAEKFSQQNVADSVASYHAFLDDVKAFNPGNPKLLFSKVSATADTAQKKLAEFKRLQDASRVPKSEVEAVLQKLKAADVSLQQWVEQASALNKKKEQFQVRLDADLQSIGELTSRLTTSAERLDALTTTLISAQDEVDHPAIAAAQDISRALRDRLDRYYYVFVTAYEYYTAKPFDSDRNPQLTADAFASFLREKNNDPAAAAQQLESVYTAAIRDAGGRIMSQLAENGGPAQQNATLVLNPSEIARLNDMLKPGPPSKDRIVINLEDRGIFRAKDLEARLVKAEVTQCSCRKVSGPPGSARFTLDVETQSLGTVRTRADNLAFRIEAGAIPWGTSVDFSRRAPTVSASTVPEDVGQTIAQIINAASPRSYATAPPLYPGISIKGQSFSDDASGRTTMHVDALSLRLTYSYRVESSAAARAVRVVVSGTETTPFFFVSAPDDRNLQHGFGSFTRLYRDARPVEIVASPVVGTATFDGWYVDGRRVERSAHLTLPSSGNSYLYEARYR